MSLRNAAKAEPFIVAYGSRYNGIAPQIRVFDSGWTTWYLFFNHIVHTTAPVTCLYGQHHVRWHPRTGFTFDDWEN